MKSNLCVGSKTKYWGCWGVLGCCQFLLLCCDLKSSQLKFVVSLLAQCLSRCLAFGVTFIIRPRILPCHCWVCSALCIQSGEYNLMYRTAVKSSCFYKEKACDGKELARFLRDILPPFSPVSSFFRIPEFLWFSHPLKTALCAIVCLQLQLVLGYLHGNCLSGAAVPVSWGWVRQHSSSSQGTFSIKKCRSGFNCCGTVEIAPLEKQIKNKIKLPRFCSQDYEVSMKYRYRKGCF